MWTHYRCRNVIDLGSSITGQRAPQDECLSYESNLLGDHMAGCHVSDKYGRARSLQESRHKTASIKLMVHCLNIETCVSGRAILCTRKGAESTA